MSGLRVSDLNKETTYLLTYFVIMTSSQTLCSEPVSVGHFFDNLVSFVLSRD